MHTFATDERVDAPREHNFEERAFLGVDVVACRGEDAVEHLVRRLKFREKTIVAYANTNLLTFVRKDEGLRNILSSFFVLNDGIGLDLASWFKYKSFFPDNLNGTDFTPRLLNACAGHRVFLYGAKPEIVEAAAAYFDRETACDVVGFEHGYITDRDQLHKRINETRADIVLVALGNPLQERWIYENRDLVNAPLMLGVGALFDFVSGSKRRAPKWVQKARLEWAVRLVQEPTRLAKRYTVDIATVLIAIFRESLSNRPTADAPRR